MSTANQVLVELTKPLITPGNEGLRSLQAGEEYLCSIDKAYTLVKNGDAKFQHGFDVLAEMYFNYVSDLHQEIKNRDNIEDLKITIERLERKIVLQKTGLDNCLHDLNTCKWILFLLTAAVTIYTSFLVATWWLNNR